MKIEIDVSDSFFRTQNQLKLILQEICKNIKEERVKGVFGESHSKSKLDIEDNKVTQLNHGTFYKKKRVTKSGVIKIRVWN